MDCIESKCYYCKHFVIAENKFDGYYVCGCHLYGDYISDCEVYDVTPGILRGIGKKYL